MDNAPQLVQDRNAPPAILVIFGASGDLTRRKLIPAVQSLARNHRLTGQFAVVAYLAGRVFFAAHPGPPAVKVVREGAGANAP